MAGLQKETPQTFIEKPAGKLALIIALVIVIGILFYLVL